MKFLVSYRKRLYKHLTNVGKDKDIKKNNGYGSYEVYILAKEINELYRILQYNKCSTYI